MISPARKARLERAKAVRAAQSKGWLRGGRWRTPCLRCGQVGPGKRRGRSGRIFLCTECWRGMSETEKQRVREFTRG